MRRGKNAAVKKSGEKNRVNNIGKKEKAWIKNPGRFSDNQLN